MASLILPACLPACLPANGMRYAEQPLPTCDTDAAQTVHVEPRVMGAELSMTLEHICSQVI